MLTPLRLLLLAAGLSVSCTVTPISELTAAQCGNLSDDDNDQLIDCADPDCAAFEVCRAAVPEPEVDSGMPMPMPTPEDSGMQPEPMRDAGIEIDASVTDGGKPLIDASMAPCVVSGCAVEEQCVNGMCVPKDDVTGETYYLTVESAVVPQIGSFGVCLDTCSVVELVVCPCKPDPYIVVTLRRAGVTHTIGVTSWISNTSEPVWSGDPFTLELQSGDELFFQAFDYDGSQPAPEILRCKPDLAQIPTGKLVCGSTAGHIDATIVPAG